MNPAAVNPEVSSLRDADRIIGMLDAKTAKAEHGQCVALPVRSGLGPPGRVPICWYGQQDASWIAHHDVLRRLGG